MSQTPSQSPTTSLTRNGDLGSVAVAATFPTDAADLWQALTDPERLARWLCVVEGEPQVGSELRLRFTTGWQGVGRVEECDEPRRLVVLTTEDATDDDPTPTPTTVTATLAPAESGTVLRVEEAGLPVGMLPAFGAGWQVHVEDLATLLAGRTPQNSPEQVRSRWQQIAPQLEQQPVQDLAEK